MNLNGTATETGAGTRREKKVVVVLGMHRSGTSLVANLLTALGVDLGGNLLAADEHNESGYWEQKEINQIQERLLRQLAQHDIGPGWMNPFPLVWDRLSRPECQDDIHRLKLVLRNEMAAAKGVFGFKDPRTSRLLPVWKRIFAELGVEPRYLLAIRTPNAVAASLAKRNEMPAEQAELLWLLHNLDAVQDAGEELRLVLDYDRWFTHPLDQAHAVSRALDLPWPDSADALMTNIKQRIRADLCHGPRTAAAILPLVAEAYEVLQQAAVTGGFPNDFRRIQEEAKRAFSLCSSWATTAPAAAAPLPAKAEFDEARYLASHPDVAEAVRAGRMISGWQHFVVAGHSERRIWFRKKTVKADPPAGDGSARSSQPTGLAQLQQNWDTLGKVDPLWAILSSPEKKNNRWQPEEFFRSGQTAIERVLAQARKLQPALPAGRALDFGCGVGRLTQALCGQFAQCDGVDIAPSMIEQARHYNCHGDRCRYHVNSGDDLRLFADGSFDFICSFIVLQHIRPEFSRRYIAEFVRVLALGGVLVFQVPGEQNRLLTGERSISAGELAQAAAKPENLIEMHGLARSEVVQLVKKCGGQILAVVSDQLAGKDAESYTYFIARESKPSAVVALDPLPAMESSEPAASRATPVGSPEWAVCTIVSKNYLAYARTFARSVRQHHPLARIFVLLVDRIDGCFDPAQEPFEVVLVEDLTKIPDPPHLFFKYDVMELNTAVKPHLLSYLFEQHGFKKVIYFDPDILVLNPLDHLVSLLDEHMMLLTPHITEPYRDYMHPTEVEINQSGIFNLGFIGLSNRPGLREFLVWWQERLYEFCASDVARGLFTDQRWVNFAPVMFAGVHILKDPGYNIAYWNLNSRAQHLRRRGNRWSHKDEPVVFFHFSGFEPKNIEGISKHQNRFQLANLPHLRPLFEEYRDLLLQNGHQEASGWRYVFDYFHNGVRIPPMARGLYRTLGGIGHYFGNPFDSACFGSFFAWLNREASGDQLRKPFAMSNLLANLYFSRGDLQRAFPDPLGGDAKAWNHWLQTTGRTDFKLDPAFLAGPGPKTAKNSAAKAAGRPSPLPFGVNISGFLTGEFGNGETTRANVRALRTAGIPNVLNNFCYGMHKERESGLTGFSAENPYAVNLIHVNAANTGVFQTVAGPKYFEGRQNIGLWWWELEQFPKRWQAAFEPYQEIWTQSKFCQQSIARAAKVPVRLFPHPVWLDEASFQADRPRFQLAPDDCVFLFSFDFMSFFERKNPLAVIQAFRLAFGDSRLATLLIKFINGHCSPAGVQCLKAAAAGLNVRFFGENLSRTQMLSLLASSDCYVSLHRSEGFGQGMAEAMFLGKPVIATNYSGNTDFMTADNSFLVRYRMIELERNYGPYERGNVWADADVQHAAEQMRFVHDHRDLARARGCRAAADIRARHSHEAVGRLMVQRLGEITGIRPPAEAAKSESIRESAPVGLSSSDVPVSIVIPVFNQLELTRKCLEKVAAHAPPGTCEVIVVDNGSTDDTAAFLRPQSEANILRLISNEKNLGFARACNQGAAAARGKYVLFLNNDTEVHAGWLAPLIQTAEADPGVGALGSKLLYPDGTIQHAGVVLLDDRAHGDPLRAHHILSRQPQDLPAANEPKVCPALTAACLFVPRDVFEQVGGFDEEFWNGYEDVDLCFRISAAGKRLVYQPASVVTHHESQSGPERFRQARQNVVRLHQKWLGKIQPDFVVQADGQIIATGTGRFADYRPAKTGEDSCAVSIIVLARNQLEHTRACLESIAAHTPRAHEVIVVDNGSNDGTPEFLKSWSAADSRRVVIRNQSNRGFAGGNNQGLAVARGEHVLLLNNDTVVTAGWLEAMLAVLARHADTGIVGPVSNRVSGPQLIREAAYKNLDEMREFAGKHAQAQAGQSLEVARAVGFCLLAKREVVDKIGGLDENFGAGNFEDDDWCIRAQLAGFHIRIACDAFVHHTGSQTFAGEKINYRAAMERNWDIFRAKWELPATATLEGGYPVPKKLPASLALLVPVRPLAATHLQDGNRWLDKQEARPGRVPVQTAAVANIGRLDEARELFQQKNYPAAWSAASAALARRPFHPEALLLLAETALAAGAGKTARGCAQRARDFAPGWSPAKQFLARSLKGDARPAWLQPSPILRPESAPRLSICLIVKNEERFLAQCLKSVRGLAAQVIVVDTGSTDRTVEIAREFGAEIYSFPWGDDFAAARNAALEPATGDWILMLDADEELPAAQHEKLQAHMKNATTIAYRLPLINAGQEEEGRSFVPRLFRNAPGVFFAGRIHEQVFASLLGHAQKWGLKTALGSAELRHHGYAREMVHDRNKIQRNLKLLRLAIEENPADVNLLMNFGLELVRSDDLAAGLEKYREAYALMSAQPPDGVVPELREVLLTQFTSQIYKVRGHEEVVQVLSSSLARKGGLTASLHFALGLAHFELKQFCEAADQMRQCLAKRKQACLTPINTDILTAAPQHCLALCLVQLGDPPAAEKAFVAALAEKDPAGAARLDYARFLQAQNRLVDALHQLNAVITANSRNQAAWQLGGEIALGRPEFLEFALDWTGAAMKAMPENPVAAAQRAEALMLNSNAPAAAQLWEGIWNSEHEPRTLAALILCEIASGQTPHLPNRDGGEQGTSLSFIHWYQKLIAAQAKPLVEKINGQLVPLSLTLPTAAQMLESALAEAIPS